LLVCIDFVFVACQLFLDFGYVGVKESPFLIKGIFFLFTGIILVPVEIELVPGFDLLPSPPFGPFNWLPIEGRPQLAVRKSCAEIGMQT